MFEGLKKHKKILVTGPQRSGTRITSQIISKDTNYFLYDEKEINFYNLEKLKTIIYNQTQFVLHCPGISFKIHEFADWVTGVVFLFRDIDEIILSEKRIGWVDSVEREKYNQKDQYIPICRVKYNFWEEQKKKIPHYYEINYESLCEHPLWVEKNLRKNFQWDETGVDKNFRSIKKPNLLKII